MRVRTEHSLKAVLAVFCVLALAVGASAQTTTATISGRVLDSQGLPVPGATVTATSPNLQGAREAVTSENGDYILTLLPSGPYSITVALTGFQTQTRNVTLAPTQVMPLEVTLGPAQIETVVQVVGRSADALTQTAQIATNFSQDLISTLPTSRDLNSILLLAPGVHPTGPAGSFSFGGSVPAHRHDCPDARNCGCDIRAFQPLHHDAGAGCELGLRSELRQGCQPVCLHHAAHAAALVRRPLLSTSVPVRGPWRLRTASSQSRCVGQRLTVLVA